MPATIMQGDLAIHDMDHGAFFFYSGAKPGAGVKLNREHTSLCRWRRICDDHGASWL